MTQTQVLVEQDINIFLHDFRQCEHCCILYDESVLEKIYVPNKQYDVNKIECKIFFNDFYDDMEVCKKCKKYLIKKTNINNYNI